MESVNHTLLGNQAEVVGKLDVEYGNQAWQQELAQQTPASLESQETNEGVLVNAI